MTERYRHGMGFSPEDRGIAHKRAGISCEFPAGCDRKNTGKVNHITGVFEAFLDHKDPQAISDINLNSALLCGPHEAQHDAQEEFQVECLKGERVLYERRITRPNQRRTKFINRQRFTKGRR